MNRRAIHPSLNLRGPERSPRRPNVTVDMECNRLWVKATTRQREAATTRGKKSVVREALRTNRAAAVWTPLRALSRSVARYATVRFTTPASQLATWTANTKIKVVPKDGCHLTCTLTARGGRHLHVRWSLQSSSVRPLSRCAMLQLLWSELHQVTDLPPHAQSRWGKWV